MRALLHAGVFVLTTVALFALVAPAEAQCSPRGGTNGGRGTNPGAPTPTGPAPTTPSPSGPAPTTPGPSRPGTTPRGPNGPTTPRIGGPRGPTTPRRGGGGIPLEFTRRSTSKEILALDWDFPVAELFKANKGDGKTTFASKARTAMPAADAYKIIAGKDRRPLLVLRECELCVGSDAALLRRSMGDEKTKLLANWFHCVKLAPDVLRANHPFRNLFPEKKPPHLFLSRSDGSGRVRMTGDMKQADLWAAMTKTLEDNYKDSPKPALKVMVKLLSEFDALDLQVKTYQDMLRKELYKNGSKSSKAKKFKAKLAILEKKKKSAMRRAKAVCDLKLIVDPVKTAGGGE